MPEPEESEFNHLSFFLVVVLFIVVGVVVTAMFSYPEETIGFGKDLIESIR